MPSHTLHIFLACLALASAKLTSLDKEIYPRDFKQIPVGTDYGEGNDQKHNKDVEEASRLDYLQKSLGATLKLVTEVKEHPTFTTALIAGDMVILDQIVKQGLIDKIQVVFVDTFHLFPETPLFMKEVEEHYGFKAKWYHAKDTETEEEFKKQFGKDWWAKDIDEYDMKCKVEPLKRSLAENNNDMWINGRRRDMGALRANLPIWEGGKLNPLAFWTFEDCWNYLRRHKVPYHPLHDHGYSSLGDVQSTKAVDLEKWFTYGGERSGRFQNLKNKDGSAKTECGIHTELPLGRKPPAQSKAP
jgi:phosphoadenosine phosphosulfate reductase